MHAGGAAVPETKNYRFILDFFDDLVAKNSKPVIIDSVVVQVVLSFPRAAGTSR